MKTSKIASSLIKQLLFCLEASGSSSDPFIIKQLSKAYRQGRSHLSPEEAFDMIVILVRKFSKVFIFLDGLEECNSDPDESNSMSDESTKLLKFAKQLLERSSTTTLKLFLSSRLEVDVPRSIPSCTQLTICQADVQRDIEKFVEEEVEDKIWLGGRTEDRELVQEIKQKLVSEAQGM
jgi:hypothetical protein